MMRPKIILCISQPINILTRVVIAIIFRQENKRDYLIKLLNLLLPLINPALNRINTKLQVKFDGHCLKQDLVTFTHKQM